MTALHGDGIIFLLIWTLVVFAIGFSVGRRRGEGRDLSGPPPAMARARAEAKDGSAPMPDPGTRERIEQALASGHKIEAIRLLREATGMGLKDAKEAVEDGRY